MCIRDSYGDDVEVLLLDGLSRADVPTRPGQTTPRPPDAVLAAQQRIGSVVLGDCP